MPACSIGPRDRIETRVEQVWLGRPNVKCLSTCVRLTETARHPAIRGHVIDFLPAMPPIVAGRRHPTETMDLLPEWLEMVARRFPSGQDSSDW